MIDTTSSIHLVDTADDSLTNIFTRLERHGFNVLAIDGTQSLEDIVEHLELLAPESRYSSIHVYGHGAPGMQQLGADLITGLPRKGEADAWRQLGELASPTADLLLYGCEVGAERAGTRLVETLSSLTGMDVAASDNITGGKDWDLEVQQGSIEADSSLPALLGWQGRLGHKHGISNDGLHQSCEGSKSAKSLIKRYLGAMRNHSVSMMKPLLAPGASVVSTSVGRTKAAKFYKDFLPEIETASVKLGEIYKSQSNRNHYGASFVFKFTLKDGTSEGGSYFDEFYIDRKTCKLKKVVMYENLKVG